MQESADNDSNSGCITPQRVASNRNVVPGAPIKRRNVRTPMLSSHNNSNSHSSIDELASAAAAAAAASSSSSTTTTPAPSTKRSRSSASRSPVRFQSPDPALLRRIAQLDTDNMRLTHALAAARTDCVAMRAEVERVGVLNQQLFNTSERTSAENEALVSENETLRAILLARRTEVMQLQGMACAVDGCPHYDSAQQHNIPILRAHGCSCSTPVHMCTYCISRCMTTTTRAQILRGGSAAAAAAALVPSPQHAVVPCPLCRGSITSFQTVDAFFLPTNWELFPVEDGPDLAAITDGTGTADA